MSAFPDSEIQVQDLRRWELSPVQFAALATALAVVGLLTIWPAVLTLWTIWTTDALKSIGMAIPVVSLVLILRAWRTLSWSAGGTWWGLVLLLITLAVAQIQQHAILILVISPRWSTALPPPALLLLAYGSGVVLLFGGVRLYRAALFPILLLWFANPVPHVFSLLVDLPLQHASASIARAFAKELGYSLTPDHLRLMFTPDFGMFIAPGCNGIRGSLTMGLIALIAGYVYRFRWYTNALVVTGAILLGYVFNLARLCILVLYYVVAMHFPSLQGRAEGADYVIGAGLFLMATLLLFAVIQRFRDAMDSSLPAAPVSPEQYGFRDGTSGNRFARLVAMVLVTLLGGAGVMRANSLNHSPVVGAEAAQGARFPEHLGNYVLVRSWNESLLTGQVVYTWGQYAPAGGGTPIAIGVSPTLGWHDALMCHFIRGDKPLWQGQLAAVTATKESIDFSSAFYDDGVTRSVEASTVCTGGACGEFATERTHFGFIYTHPTPQSLYSADPRRPIPILLRAESIDTTAPSGVIRSQLTQDLRSFLESVRVDDLTQPYSR